MNELIFVTTNKGKVESAKMMLREYGYSVTQIIDRIVEPEETNDPKLIVREKVLNAVRKYNRPVMCEDSGFFVNALGGRPGAKLHGYLDEKGIFGMLNELDGKPDRTAYFIAVVAYMEPGWKEPVYFEEKIEGELADKPRGDMKPYSWSELHLIFVPRGKSKTLAEMSDDEYHTFRFNGDSRFKRLGAFIFKK